MSSAAAATIRSRVATPLLVRLDCAVTTTPDFGFAVPFLLSQGGSRKPFLDLGVRMNNTALVTGSTGGIGAATAALLAAAGYEVVVSGRDVERGNSVVKQITADGGSARFVAADLHDLDSLRSLADAAGPVDILINNAGMFPGAPLVSQDVESFDAAFALNVRAPYFLSAALVPGMIERGRGSIVNVSTMAASVGMPGLSAYGA